MNKAVKHSFRGMAQDISKSQFSNEYYFEGKNIRIIATDSQSTGNITNEKGNELILTVPVPVINYTTKEIHYDSNILSFTTTEISNLFPLQSTTQTIVGQCITRDYIILITTDNNGVDCVWKINHDAYNITLLYLRDMGLSTNNPIQILNNFENKNIDKIYWVDAKNQMRFLNIKHSILNQDLEELINVPVTVVNMVGQFNLSQPYISQIVSGGIHTAGVIQYAYNLYRLNSSQTKLSPISQLVSLDNGILGGASVNETVNTLPIIRIDNIDKDYTNIRVYSIKYTSYNEVPTISLIEDRSIPSTNFIEVYDDGNAIHTLSLEEFLFLGSDIMIPKHINTKHNRLFFANYEEVNFKVELDTRAYSFNNTSNSIVYHGLFLNTLNNIDWDSSRIITNSFTNDQLDKYDSINLNYDNYKYQYNGITFGGEGKYLKYELTQSTKYDPDAKYYKDDEIYRLGIQFYNKYGQNTLPNWVSDFKAREGNLVGNYNTLKFTLKPDFFIWLNTTVFTNDYDIPVGYRILVAERNSSDKTIVANGLLSTMMINDKSTKQVKYTNSEDIIYVQGKSDELPKLPNVLVRNTNESSLYGSTRPLRKTEHLAEMCIKHESPDTEFQRSYADPFTGQEQDTTGRLYQYNVMTQLYSPEILFKDAISLTDSLQFKVKGAYKNTYNANWGKRIAPSNSSLRDEAKGYDGISVAYSSGIKQITGNEYGPFEYGLFSTGGGDPDITTHAQFYRGYGKINITDVYSQNSKIVVIENDISLISPFTDTEGYINQIAGGRGISVILSNGNSNISYSITPNILSTQYTAKICSDIEGNNVIVNSGIVTGNHTISYPATEVSAVILSYYYLVIEAIDGFSGSIDLSISTDWMYHTEYESLNNLFTVNSNTASIVNDSFTPSPNNLVYNIYGKPEITEKGQASILYNNDSKLRYTNTLTSILTDGDSTWDHDGQFGRRIVSINSDNNRCITMVLGPTSTSVSSLTRPKIDANFLLSQGLDGNDNVLIVELIKSRNDIYLSNIYGGNTYEDKQRTKYIEIGDYKNIDITIPSHSILSPGDTFVNNFRFARIVRKEEKVILEGTYQYEEIVEYPTETTIDLKNRNDLSLNTWDSRFNPLDSEYHKYNRVYSQLSNLITRRNIDYNIKKINSFDTNVISSKLKSGGELIDNWTDIQVNEVLTLDGKYGPINALSDFNDELYSIQDTGFAFLSINPRVQIQGADGIALELGSGGVLQDYKYASSKSGTLNKWSVVSTPLGIYFFDTLNKSLNVFKGNVSGLSDLKNMHTYFLNNCNIPVLSIDNPILHTGISTGYDLVNNDMLMTFHQGIQSFTVSFNEISDTFVSLYDYTPTYYMSHGNSLITSHPNNTKLYKHFTGEYNKFYENYYPSYIILNVNPEYDLDCVFDNVNFKTDVTLNGVDQPSKTLTGIRAYNDYQDSNTPSTVTPIIVGRNDNARRKFRDWNVLVPRQGRQRIRAPYIKLKLQFDNESNYKLILHPLNIYYSI